MDASAGLARPHYFFTPETCAWKLLKWDHSPTRSVNKKFKVTPCLHPFSTPLSHSKENADRWIILVPGYLPPPTLPTPTESQSCCQGAGVCVCVCVCVCLNLHVHTGVCKSCLYVCVCVSLCECVCVCIYAQGVCVCDTCIWVGIGMCIQASASQALGQFAWNTGHGGRRSFG
jgi:hypothetical protein